MSKEFILDEVGNKVHVGDEVIYIEYKAPISKKNIFTVTRVVGNYSVEVDYQWTRCDGKVFEEKKVISRFLKVVREKDND